MPYTFKRSPNRKRLRRTRTARRRVHRNRKRQTVFSYRYKVLLKNQFQIEMNGLDQPKNLNFKLVDVVNSAELTALYDRYKIAAASALVVPRQTEMIYQTAPGVDDGGTSVPNTDFGGTHLFGTSNFGHPEVLSVIDYDDVKIEDPTFDMNAALQYGSLKITRGNRMHKRYLKPKIVIDSANTGVLPKYSQWLDAERPDVPHNGLKFLFANVPSISPTGTSDHPVINYDVILTYYLQFKDPV